MNEYEVLYESLGGRILTAFIYGVNEEDAMRNAVHQGLDAKRIVRIDYKEPYRGYGHI